MRNLNDYVINYNSLDFEDVQEKFRKKDLLSVISKLKPKRILEVGCGRDSILNHVSSDIKITVVEPALHFYHNAVCNSHGMTNVDVVNCVIEEYDKCDPHDFDLIILSSILHEIVDKHEFLRKIYRLMGPHTKLYVNVPNRNSFHRLLAYESGIISSVNEVSDTQIKMQQFSEPFSQDTLASLLEYCNFKVCKNYTIFLKPFTHEQMKLLLENKIITLKVIEGLYNINKHFPVYGSEICILAMRKDT